jgi:hypothetical protein
MELIEMIGWIGIGFVPMLAARPEKGSTGLLTEWIL